MWRRRPRWRTRSPPRAAAPHTGEVVMLIALRKELLLQWRSRAQFLAVLVFGAAALLLFSFAIGPDASALRQFSGGFLWLGLLLSSTLTLAESFHAEMENQALEGMLLLPTSPVVIY